MLKIKMNGQAQVIEDRMVKDFGKDESGKEYSVTFKVFEDFDLDTNSDLSDAADWNSPVEVWDIEEQEEVEITTVELEY